MSKVFFTSDTHFSHANIIKYCNRPFANPEEMNKALVERWNSRVRPEDVVYHLGDFAMGQKKLTLPIRRQLNGKIVLIRGNHDPSISLLKEFGFEEVYNNLTLEVEGLKLYLSHIPAHIADPYEGRQPHEAFAPELLATPPVHDYFICGHVHDKWARQGNTINAGMDVSNFYPITLQGLLKRDIEENCSGDS